MAKNIISFFCKISSPLPVIRLTNLFPFQTKVILKSKTVNGLSYSLHREKYLRCFLEDGEVPMDDNAAEQSIHRFCIGKKNWVIIDTITGAESSAVIYSLSETAKANNLKSYDYFEYLLTEIPKHIDDHDRNVCKELLP